MSCPECQEQREFALEQMKLAQHVTRAQNQPTPPQTPKEALPAGSNYHRG